MLERSKRRGLFWTRSLLLLPSTSARRAEHDGDEAPRIIQKKEEKKPRTCSKGEAGAAAAEGHLLD